MLYITPEILAAINAIAAAGHGIEIDEKTSSGNSHTSTFITVCCRKPNERAYTKKLIIKHTASYGKFSEWTGFSPEFGDLCYSQTPNVDLLVKKATELA